MGDPVVKVQAGNPVTVKLVFDGIANHYEAYLYAPAGNDEWKRVQTLETDGSSEDARPDELTFDAPAPGKRMVFYFQSAMTAVVVPATIGVTAVFQQNGKELVRAPVAGNIETFEDVKLRVLLEAS